VEPKPPLVHLTPLDPSFPSRLRDLSPPPASLTLRGGSLEADRVIAVVGTRHPAPEAYAYARDLAAGIVRAGGVVVSGGALGIDEAAHEGALAEGGRTWCVAGTGHEHVFPPGHASLFERIAEGPGTMLWPFAPSYAHRAGFLVRNGLLAALADALVVVQAGFPSGALRAAACARRLKRPLWVVPVPPWEPWSGAGFAGSRKLLMDGATPLLSTDSFLTASGLLGGPKAAPTTEAGAAVDVHASPRRLTEVEERVLAATKTTPLHLDAIVELAHLSAQATSAALLTLALEHVVVEGPPGFFRHGNTRKR
jgi:DNA processing protein